LAAELPDIAWRSDQIDKLMSGIARCGEGSGRALVPDRRRRRRATVPRPWARPSFAGAALSDRHRHGPDPPAPLPAALASAAHPLGKPAGMVMLSRVHASAIREDLLNRFPPS